MKSGTVNHIRVWRTTIRYSSYTVPNKLYDKRTCIELDAFPPIKSSRIFSSFKTKINDPVPLIKIKTRKLQCFSNRRTLQKSFFPKIFWKGVILDEKTTRRVKSPPPPYEVQMLALFLHTLVQFDKVEPQ